MAGLAHCEYIAQCVGATCCDTMDFPLSPEHRIAPSGVMTAQLHLALAFATCSLEHLFSNV